MSSAGTSTLSGRTRTAACRPAPNIIPPPKPCTTRDAIKAIPSGASPIPMQATPNRHSPAARATLASRLGMSLVPNTSMATTPSAEVSMNAPM